ncbi:hypothetical protein B0A58_15470 [Flavobacterium branchiophilum NBRC 15030 = ATCC 35035]|uniref:Uncharacterized protein n=1 Tax=Flavobacterium branchiophilum TaxID=55197 RepID=A0A543G4U6_9FLAO|nr:hypothetical protein [Flavobacterium branchiophilum]OXA69334.1 hypothetical protein B0A58_15470 [Flavobacterium branchiophilum NBRC 15030 = ATCC 35035]TQM41099.1 hypothetical protein BC670_2033 [Flavobacterium branchiophilum]GEM55589.1 hypothetical protein FB1_18100 [Flavobacterium branchiophilum NBRC 15030 = ATCC 35035]
MKNLFLLSILLITINGCNGQKTNSVTNTKTTTLKDKSLVKKTEEITTKESVSKDSVVNDDSSYEDDIEVAISQSFQKRDSEILETAISKVEKDLKISLNYKTYWKTYLYYNLSLLYTALKDDDKASFTIDTAIETIEEKANSSEDFALLAACKSFSLKFANMTKLASISAEVGELANKSLELNPKNMRAYYVLATNNFYTPKMFGGMVKVEEYSLKALDCPYSISENYYAPYWCKPKVYQIYIQYLNMEKKESEAKKIKEKAKKEFPNSNF